MRSVRVYSAGSGADASSSTHSAHPTAAPIALSELPRGNAALSGGGKKENLSVLRGISIKSLVGSRLSTLVFDSQPPPALQAPSFNESLHANDSVSKGD